MDEKLRQLYLYSVGVEQKYGQLPKWLCFNCFKTHTFIKEPFNPEAYEKTKQWALNLIGTIENTPDFDAPNIEYFYCIWLCGESNSCDYYRENFSKGRR